MNIIKKAQEAATLGTVQSNQGIQLQSLSLSEGTIRFEPDVTEYYVTVSEDVTRILVKGVTYEDDSFYTVSGNSNMKNGYNDIVITVTDKDGNIGNYYIHVLVGEVQTENEEVSSVLPQENASSLSSDGIHLEGILQDGLDEFSAFVQTVTSGNLQYMSYGVAGCGALALLLWIILFIRRLAAKRKFKRERRERLARREERKKQWEIAEQQQDVLLRQVDELLEKKKRSRGPVEFQEPEEEWQEDPDFEDYDDYEDYEDYEDYDENEAELDHWLAGLDEGNQDEDR